MFIQMYEEKYMRFPQGKSKALTFSYDDGVKADKKLVSIMDKHGLKGTFNLNCMLFGNECECWHGRMGEEETFNLYKSGVHEVALHGARHIFLDKVPMTEAINEIVQNRVYLENKFGKIVRGMAYAYHGYDEKIADMVGAMGVKYARTTDPSYSFAIPKDWLRLKPTCHHADEKLDKLMDKFLNKSPEEGTKDREPWLFYIWGHSFEFEEHGNWEIIENIAKRVDGRKDIWFATNGEIYDYVEAYNNLIFSMDGEIVKNPSYMPVWLEIRGKVYKIDAGKEVRFDK